MLQLARATIRDIDALLGQSEFRDTTAPAGSGLPDRELGLWTIAGLPIKLVVTEPNRTDRIFPETTYWFEEGVVKVVSDTLSLMFFENDELILWADEVMAPTTPDRQVQLEQERVVLDSLRSRMSILGLEYR